MNAVIWTAALVSIGVTGLWLAPRTWWGWVVNSCAEVMWFVYALTIDSAALAVMACVWLAVNVRNAVTTRRVQTTDWRSAWESYRQREESEHE